MMIFDLLLHLGYAGIRTEASRGHVGDAIQVVSKMREECMSPYQWMGH